MENFHILTFPAPKFRFSSAKISYDFFSQISNSPIFRFSSAKISYDIFFTNFEFPYFCYFNSFSHMFRKFVLFSPTFANSPWFLQIHMLYTYFMCFWFPPYLDHDEFMHHTMHYWTPLSNNAFISGGFETVANKCVHVLTCIKMKSRSLELSRETPMGMKCKRLHFLSSYVFGMVASPLPHRQCAVKSVLLITE